MKSPQEPQALAGADLGAKFDVTGFCAGADASDFSPQGTHGWHGGDLGASAEVAGFADVSDFSPQGTHGWHGGEVGGVGFCGAQQPFT